MKKLLYAALLAAMALMPAASFGSSITGIVEGQADGNAWNGVAGDPQSCSYGFNSSISSGSCTYLSNGLINSGPWLGQPNTYTADVYSSVDLTTGSLHAFAGQSFANFPIDTRIFDDLPQSTAADADAIASVGDILTFTAPGQVVPMKIVFKVALDGVFKSFESVEAGGYAQLDYGSGFGNFVTFTDQASGGTIYSTPAETVNGNAYTYFFTLTAYSELACGAGSANFTHLCSASESTDFSDTAQITGIELEDMSGNQLNGYTVTSQSGIDYNPLLTGDASVAPEPDTWALAGGALFIVGAGMRRRKRSAL